MPLIEELPPRGEEAEAPTGGASRRPPGEGSSVAASSFSFGKSLAGAAGEGGGGAPSGAPRGDGSFADGSNVNVQPTPKGNVVRLSQAALDPANIAETTRRLEQLGAIPSAQSKGAGGQAQAQPQAQAVPRLDKEQFKEAAKEALMDDAMAQGLSRLFDESLAAAEGRQRSGGGGGGGDGGLLDELDTEEGVAGAASASAFKFGGEEKLALQLTERRRFQQALPTPKHFMREATDKRGRRVYECAIELPGVASAAEAAAELHVAPRALELSVPGRFATLRVRLPAQVVDGDAKAKWKRAECKLVVSMPLAGQ